MLSVLINKNAHLINAGAAMPGVTRTFTRRLACVSTQPPPNSGDTMLPELGEGRRVTPGAPEGTATGLGGRKLFSF